VRYIRNSRIAQLIKRLTTDWTVRGSNPGKGRDFSHTSRPTLEAHPASYTMGTGSFPGVKRPRRGVDHPPHLAPRLKKEYSYATSLLGLRGLLQGKKQSRYRPGVAQRVPGS
jgi:hypothetical protein